MRKILKSGLLILCLISFWACNKTQISKNPINSRSGILFYGDDYGHDLRMFEQTMDKGFVFGGFIGTSSGSCAQGFIQKTDQNGRVEWYNTYGGAYNDRFYAVHQTSDGGYIAAGYTSSEGAGITNGDYYSDAYLVRTDPGGKVLWEKPYSAFGGPYDDIFFEVAETPGHEFVAVGYTALTGGGNELFVEKVDKNGHKLWSRTLLNVTWRSLGVSVAFGPKGEIAVACYSVVSGNADDQGKYYPVFIYLDASGQVLVPGVIYKNLGAENVEYYHNSTRKFGFIISRPDGFIIASNIGTKFNSAYISGPYVIMFKIDFSGKIL